jgi:type IV secretory pathway TraG/TraD family ATPase VirD4
MQLAVGGDRTGRPALDSYVKEAERELRSNAEAQAAASDFRKAVDELSGHVAAGAGEGKNRRTVEQFMQQAFGVFRLEKYQCYSPTGPARRSLYDQILDEGKFVLVSMDPQEVKLTSLLPALVKLVFQRAVVSRFGRYRNWELHNCVRPVLFMADEYHTVATKVPGMFGDSEFFSLARQFGALSFVATQSLQQLAVSSLQESWKAILDVLSAVIVMSGNDPETRKFVDELAGNEVVRVKKRSPSFSEGKETIGVSYERLERSVIPVGTLQMLTRGQAIVVGKIGGQQEASSVRYLKVPDYRKE